MYDSDSQCGCYGASGGRASIPVKRMGSFAAMSKIMKCTVYPMKNGGIRTSCHGWLNQVEPEKGVSFLSLLCPLSPFSMYASAGREEGAPNYRKRGAGLSLNVK